VLSGPGAPWGWESHGASPGWQGGSRAASRHPGEQPQPQASGNTMAVPAGAQQFNFTHFWQI